MRYSISDKAIDAIKDFEGFRSYAYRDSAGVPTIGYGHTKGVRMGMACTKERAESWLCEDLRTAELQVNGLNVCRTQGQFDALVDFVFNLGFGALRRSTLLRKIRHSAPTEQIQAEFRKWVHAGGRVLHGLVKRREWEAKRWAE